MIDLVVVNIYNVYGYIMSMDLLLVLALLCDTIQQR